MKQTLTVLDLTHPALAGRTGRGVSVAVVDSGVNPGHAHIGELKGGLAIGDDGTESDDFVDGLGHGTAVAAAIHEKAPAADLYAIKVFGRSLAARAESLARAIDWAAGRGVRLINLSLGTVNGEREAMLGAAVEQAASHGALVVSAFEPEGRRWLPGSLPGVVAAVLDWDCPRNELWIGTDRDSRPVFRASGYPRPIPGVPPERNLRGLSFAVANVAGFLARLVEGRSQVQSVEGLRELV